MLSRGMMKNKLPLFGLFLPFILTVFGLYFFSNHVQSKPLQYADVISEEYKNLEDALNTPSASLKSIDFLHDFIAEKAQFTVSFQDGNQQKHDDIHVDKVAFINSFLESRPFIDDYRVQINDLEILSQDNKTLVVLHKMVETGVIEHKSSKPQNFTSVSNCTFNHKLNAKNFVVVGGECKTAIQINQDI